MWVNEPMCCTKSMRVKIRIASSFLLSFITPGCHLKEPEPAGWDPVGSPALCREKSSVPGLLALSVQPDAAPGMETFVNIGFHMQRIKDLSCRALHVVEPEMCYQWFFLLQ